MAATENIQREVAVVIVIAVKELAGLLAVHGNIVVIKVQHDLLGWLVMLLNEVMPQQLMGLHHRLPVYLLLAPSQCRLTRQDFIFT